MVHNSEMSHSIPTMGLLFNKLTIAVVVLTIVVILNETEQSPVVQLGTVEFYDQFGDDVQDMIYPGGYILIECIVQICQPNEAVIELVGPIGQIAIGSCEKDVQLRLDITERTPFGHYRCKHGSELSEKYFHYQYRFCSPLDAACSKSCRDDGPEYCMIHSTGHDNKSIPCIINEDKEFKGYEYCHSHYSDQKSKHDSNRIKYCGAEKLCECKSPQPSNLCQAHSEGKLRHIMSRVFDPNVTASCFLDESVDPTLSNNSLPYPRLWRPSDYRYNGILTSYDLDGLVFFDIPYHYIQQQVTMNCTLKVHGGKVVWHHAVSVAEHAEAKYNYGRDQFLNARFITELAQNGKMFAEERGLGIYKLGCNFVHETGFILADTNFYVLVGSGKAAKLAVIKANTTDDGRYTRSLTCELLSSLPSQFVIKDYKWFVNPKYGEESIGEVIESVLNFASLDGSRKCLLRLQHGPEIVPMQNGTYRCGILIAARCRKPDSGPDGHLSSDGIKVTIEDATPTTSMSSSIVLMSHQIIFFTNLVIYANTNS